MAEHKAAADVTVVPRGEEKSGFARWIEKNGLIVLVGLILISAVIVVQSQMSQAATADEKAQWAALTEAMSGDAQSVPGLAGASTEGLTFKQVNRACRGRRLTPKMRAKVQRAVAAAVGEPVELGQLFDYR